MLENLTLHPVVVDVPVFRQEFVGKLSDLDLEKETLQHYLQVKNYMENLDLDSVEPNKVTSVFNSLSAILKDLSKIQIELASAEKLKKIESALVIALKTLPTETCEIFYQNYLQTHENLV